MRRMLTGVTAGVLAIGSGGSAAEQPPLMPPVLGPPIAVEEDVPLELPPPLEATPVPRSSAPASEVGPMLVLPGINTPRPSNRGQTPRPAVAPRATAPIVAPRSEEAARPGRPAPGSDLPPILDAGPEPRVAPDLRDVPRRNPPAARPSETEARPLRGFLRKLFGPAGAEPDRLPELPESSTPADSASDPAADAALKRKLERQIEATLGDRLRSLDVRVVGRQVVIRAETLRFWQRRGVRNHLESMPVLAGYRTRVYVDE